MFREMRRKDRMLSLEEARELLENGMYGVLSVTGTDGYPYGVPVNYIMADGKIYMHGSREEGLKGECITANPKISFTVIQPLKDADSKSVIVFGTAQKAPEAYDMVMEKLVEKFVPPFAWEQAKQGIPFAKNNITIYEITIDHMSAKLVCKRD